MWSLFMTTQVFFHPINPNLYQKLVFEINHSLLTSNEYELGNTYHPPLLSLRTINLNSRSPNRLNEK